MNFSRTKELCCETHILNTPIRDEDLEKIEIGDIVYLNGALITARDQAHHRLVKLGRKLPVDLNRKAILHAGPIMVPAEDVKSGWKVASIGPTTSMRMELSKGIHRRNRRQTHHRQRRHGSQHRGGVPRKKAIHCVFPGGCAVVAAACVEEVEDHQWPELGMPESMWMMRVKKFGPLICSIDTQGRNLFKENKKVFEERKAPIVERIWLLSTIKNKPLRADDERPRPPL